MPNDPHDDAKSTWQNQSTETSALTLEMIRKKARELQAKTRRALLSAVTVPLTVAFLYWFATTQFPQLQHVLHPLFGIALVWSLAGLYFLTRGKWSGAMP